MKTTHRLSIFNLLTVKDEGKARKQSWKLKWQGATERLADNYYVRFTNIKEKEDEDHDYTVS